MYKPRLAGMHYDMGHKYGALLYKNNVRLDELLVFDEERLAFGVESLKICKTVYPEIIDEIKGLADGLHVDESALGTFIITAGAYNFDIGCSNMAVKTECGVFFGRNHDMFTVLKKTCESSLVRPESGYTFIGQSDCFVGKEDGINEHGLAVGMNFVAPKSVKPGLNFLIIVRMLLEKCKTVAQALLLIENMPVMTSHNILLADKSGDMAVVEMCSERFRVRRPKSNFLVSTNHFQHDDMLKYENRPEENWFMTLDRSSCIEKAIESGIEISVESIQEILSNKYGNLTKYDKSIPFDTLWSLSAELKTLQISRADGNPARAKFNPETRLKWAMDKQ